MNKKLILGMLLIAGSATGLEAQEAADKQGLAAFNKVMAAFYQTPTGIKYKKILSEGKTVLNATKNAYDTAHKKAINAQNFANIRSLQNTKEGKAYLVKAQALSEEYR